MLLIGVSFGVFRWAPVANEVVKLAIAAALSIVALAAMQGAWSMRRRGSDDDAGPHRDAAR